MASLISPVKKHQVGLQYQLYIYFIAKIGNFSCKTFFTLLKNEILGNTTNSFARNTVRVELELRLIVLQFYTISLKFSIKIILNVVKKSAMRYGMNNVMKIKKLTISDLIIIFR
jgi:hypothetical protein